MINTKRVLSMSIVIILLIGCSMAAFNIQGKTIATGGRRTQRLMQKLNAADDQQAFMQSVVDPSWKSGVFKQQKLDHFNSEEQGVWSQRYATVSGNFKAGKPVFIFLAGEAPMEFFEFQELSAVAWAQQFDALYISLEHRFYGESAPTADASNENMKYLSSQQALADAAVFIEWFNNTQMGQYGGGSGPWVVFGCSYSGALSSWFRLKYPHLVVASVAPSGPVLAQLNYTGYYKQFERSADASCVSAVKQGADEIYAMYKTESGRKQLSSMFKSCQPLTEDNSWFFFYNVKGAVGGMDQMDNPVNPESEGGPWPLNKTCAAMTKSSNYAQNWADWYNGANAEQDCNSFDEDAYVNSMMGPKMSGGRSWFFQKCSEFGFFKPTYQNTSIFFPNGDLEHEVAWCERIFGVNGMTPHTEFTNAFYGGKSLDATNVLFTNGLKDPWHLLSITENEGSVEAVTYEAGHCAPMTKPSPMDPPSLTQARQKVMDFLTKVLN